MKETDTATRHSVDAMMKTKHPMDGGAIVAVPFEKSARGREYRIVTRSIDKDNRIVYSSRRR